MLTKKLGNKKNVTKELNVHGTDDNSSWHTGKFWKPEKNILGFVKDWTIYKSCCFDFTWLHKVCLTKQIEL